MVGSDIALREKVTDMTQDLKFEKVVLIGTAIMAVFLFVAQGI